MANELGKWAGKRTASPLQNHGPVVVCKSLSAALDLMEEFEEAAKLAYLLKGDPVRYLSPEEI